MNNKTENGTQDGIVDAEIVSEEVIQEGDSGKAVVVAETLMPTKGLEATPPEWMSPEEVKTLDKSVDDFMERIKINPGDLDIQTSIYKLGDDGTKAMIPSCNLFEVKIVEVMKLQQEGDPITGGILQIKQALDQINPTVLKNLPIKVKFAVLLSKTRLPKAEEVADMIYERRETIKSTIEGLKRGLLASADMLIEDLEEIKQIYVGMLEAQRMIERDVYWGQALHGKLLPYSQSLSDPLAVQVVEDNLAALTQVINALQSEEAANMVFFANAQNYAKQNNLQLFNIRRRIPLLERSVLANLGLKAGMARLEKTMKATDALTDAVGDTLADAAAAGRRMGNQMTEARGKAIINLDKLQAAINDIEGMYNEQAEANKKVIAIGTKTSQDLTKMVGRIKDRVEGGHDSMATKQ